MATLKFSYTGKCSGGNHYQLDVMVDAARRRGLSIPSSDLLTPPHLSSEEVDAAIYTLLKLHRLKWMKANPGGTNNQYLTALEAEEWEF